MKSKWLRNLIGGLSFTSALFIFQACYGTPQDLQNDLFLSGRVTAGKTGLPIKGIKVSVAENNRYEFTDSEGRFSFYTEILDKLTMLFEDTDSDVNGNFLNKDTVINKPSGQIFLEVKMLEK